MKRGLVFLIIFSFIMVSGPLVNADDYVVDEGKIYAYSDNLEGLEGDLHKLSMEMSWFGAQVAGGSNIEISDIGLTFYVIQKFDDNLQQIAKSKFLEFGLAKKGAPILNLLVLYSTEDDEVRIIYPDYCAHNKEELEKLAEKTSISLKEVDNLKPLINLAEELYSLTGRKFNEIRDNPILYCPISEVEQYLPEKNNGEEKCKAFFSEDTFSDGRLKILLLGKNFKGEEDFDAAISKYVLQEGFQKIEPFKTYTKEGNNGLLYLVKGDYNLGGGIPFLRNTDLEATQEFNNRMKEDIAACPNVFYTIVLINDAKEEGFRSYYSPNIKASFNELNGATIVHETGHRFQLSDEYFEFGLGDFVLGSSMKFGCTKDPSNWNDVIGQFGDHNFKTCGLKSEEYRSSYNSIMRNTNIYNKFNFLSCLVLVREFENLPITNEKVGQICLALYNQGELQKSEGISEEDPYYIYCIKSVNKLNKEIDCKAVLLECAREEARENQLDDCIDNKISENEHEE
jgi:hypothetical protein